MEFDFLQAVKDSLNSFGWTPDIPLCAGISGGADSVSLLVSLACAAKSCGAKKIHVVTVDHAIRKASESYGDALFVKKLCSDLSSDGFEIDCSIIRLKEGQVEQTAVERKKGTEEAARFLRYSAFEECALTVANQAGCKNVFFALAHNADDQAETLVMRFLQGAGSSRTGILDSRKVILNKTQGAVPQNDSLCVTYIRPLLNICRTQIEEFLNSKNIVWRTDSTNQDCLYLRNKIRNQLVPLLNEISPGWQKALFNGRQKALMDCDALDSITENYQWESCGTETFRIKKDLFYGVHQAVRLRLLYKVLGFLNFDRRFEFDALNEIAKSVPESSVTKNGLEFTADSEFLFVKKSQKKATISGIFAIIKKEDEYFFDAGTLKVTGSNQEGICNLCFVTNDGFEHFFNGARLPFVFRSRQPLDQVTADGKCEPLSQVLDSLGVKGNLRDAVPVVEELDSGRGIIAVWGSVLGFSDWVKVGKADSKP